MIDHVDVAPSVQAGLGPIDKSGILRRHPRSNRLVERIDDERVLLLRLEEHLVVQEPTS
jgi:hypothetical protein